MQAQLIRSFDLPSVSRNPNTTLVRNGILGIRGKARTNSGGYVKQRAYADYSKCGWKGGMGAYQR